MANLSPLKTQTYEMMVHMCRFGNRRLQMSEVENGSTGHLPVASVQGMYTF
jgi:hypothetical protein